MADGTWIGHGTGIRALARKKKKELERRERGGSEYADFRLRVHTSQQECAPQEKKRKEEEKSGKEGEVGAAHRRARPTRSRPAAGLASG